MVYIYAICFNKLFHFPSPNDRFWTTLKTGTSPTGDATMDLHRPVVRA